MGLRPIGAQNFHSLGEPFFMEKTFVLVKPDGVQRGLIGEVIARLERRGLKLVAAKFIAQKKSGLYSKAGYQIRYRSGPYVIWLPVK